MQSRFTGLLCHQIGFFALCGPFREPTLSLSCLFSSYAARFAGLLCHRVGHVYPIQPALRTCSVTELAIFFPCKPASRTCFVTELAIFVVCRPASRPCAVTDLTSFVQCSPASRAYSVTKLAMLALCSLVGYFISWPFLFYVGRFVAMLCHKLAILWSGVVMAHFYDITSSSASKVVVGGHLLVI